MIPITRPEIDEGEAEGVARVLRTGWVSQGPEVERFEAAFAEYVGCEYAIATTSCTTALHLALLASGIQPGDEVLIPAFTFVATANAVEYCGARPVLVDIEPCSMNLDPAEVERLITPQTRAIIPVHLFGRMAPMDAIADIADRHGLAVIEDAACALGTWARGRHAGTLGQSGCFSFHPRKVITTGEGGMLTTNDPEIASRTRSLRNHGATVSDLERHERGGTRLPPFSVIGYNYRMTDIQAAVGLAQMNKLDSILSRRRELAERYDRALENLPFLTPAAADDGSVHSYQSYVRMLTPDAGVTRDQVAAHLDSLGIATRQGTHAVHLLECYRQRYALQPDDFPNARSADARSITFPLFASMDDAEHQAVVDALYELA